MEGRALHSTTTDMKILSLFLFHLLEISNLKGEKRNVNLLVVRCELRGWASVETHIVIPFRVE